MSIRFGLKPLKDMGNTRVGIKSRFGLKLKSLPESVAEIIASLSWQKISNAHVDVTKSDVGWTYSPWLADIAVYDGKVYAFGGVVEGDEFNVATNIYPKIECRDITDGSLLWSKNIMDVWAFPDAVSSPVTIDVDATGIYLSMAVDMFLGGVHFSTYSRIEKRSLSTGELDWGEDIADFLSVYPVRGGSALSGDGFIVQFGVWEADALRNRVINFLKTTGFHSFDVPFIPDTNESIKPSGICATGNYIYATDTRIYLIGAATHHDANIRKLNIADGSMVWVSTRSDNLSQRYESINAGAGSLVGVVFHYDAGGPTTYAAKIEMIDYDTGVRSASYPVAEISYPMEQSCLASDGIWLLGGSDLAEELLKYDFSGNLVHQYSYLDVDPYYYSVPLVANDSLFMGGDMLQADGGWAWLVERRTAEGVL